MKEVLSDVIKQVANLYDNVIISGDDDTTTIDAQANDKMFFLVANVKKPVLEFKGEFGLGSLQLLKGLLDFASYKTDESKFIIHRKEHEGAEEVSEFEFRDREGAKTKFKTISTRFIDTKRSALGKMPWEISVVITKAKATEIQQLATMLSEVDKFFGLTVEEQKLFLTIGGKNETVHAATIFITDGVENKMLNSNKANYNMTNFLHVLKRAENGVCTVHFCSRGILGITVETDHVVYNYFLRADN